MKKNNLRFLCFLVLLALSLPANVFAQQEGGMLGYGESEGNDGRPMEGLLKGGSISYTNVEYPYGNQPFGVEPNDYAPLGSGVLVLMAAGVGYVVVKSKKRKRVGLMLMLPVLLMGLTQCNKEKEIPEAPVLEGDTYHISVSLGRGSDTRADVYPDDSGPIAPVYYEKGIDQLLVVYKGAVVGTITCIDTNNYHPNNPSYPQNYYYASADFDGDIVVSSGAIDGSSVLYFYYIGNRSYTTSGNSITVDISDQTGRLPVISYACSAEAFSGSGPYTIYNGHNGEGHHWLLNQCALVKFECENIYDMSANTRDNNPDALYKTTKDIIIYGMDNQVTIDLANTTMFDPHFSWGRVNNGAIKLHTRPQDASGDGSVRYAIVNHAQSDLNTITEGHLEVPFDPESDLYGFFGTFKVGKSLVKNEYYPGGKLDLVWHSGAFKVATVPDPTIGEGDPGALHLDPGTFSSPYYIVFSRGNLQYKCAGTYSETSTGGYNHWANENSGNWRFAKHQYDFVGGGLLSSNNTYLGNVVLDETNSSDANNSDNEQIGGFSSYILPYSGPVTYYGWIDLFGFGTGNRPRQCRQENHYYGTYTDWGNNPIMNDGRSEMNGFWRALGRDEWQYLLEHRPSASGKIGFATVCDIHGLILLPELFNTGSMPAGCGITTFVEAQNSGGVPACFSTMVLDANNWMVMEQNGAVFLPAAGYRGSGTSGILYDLEYDGGGPTGTGGEDQDHGAYWSSTKATKYTNGSAFYMRFGNNIIGDHVNPGYYMAPDNGNSVRLIHQVTSPSSKFFGK